MMPRSMATLLLLVSCLLSSALTLALGSGQSGDGYTIVGRVKIEGLGTKGFGLPTKISNAKVILNGGERVSFVRPDVLIIWYHLWKDFENFLFFHPLGFRFMQSTEDNSPLVHVVCHNVSAGTHLLEVAAMGYFFSPVRVDVSARNPGKIQAALTENRRILNELVLEPLREEQYYEIREPFSIMSLLKSPMGLMVGFMVIVVFLMPKLMENIDPEEMRRAQEEMRNQGVPSISGLISGRSS